MTRWPWKAVQLLALIPVAVLSALAASMAFAGIGNAFTRWDFGHLLFGAVLLLPLFAVFCLYFAIMQDPEALRARPRLAAMVVIGLVCGILLAALVIPWGGSKYGLGLDVWTLVLVLPVALAILHIVRIARARPVSAAGPPMGSPPLE